MADATRYREERLIVSNSSELAEVLPDSMPEPVIHPGLANVEFLPDASDDSDIDIITKLNKSKLAALEERLSKRERKVIVPSVLPSMTKLETKIGFRLPKGCVSVWGRKNSQTWAFVIEIEEGIKTMNYHIIKGPLYSAYRVYWPRSLWFVYVWRMKFLGMNGYAIRDPYCIKGRKTVLYDLPVSNNRMSLYGTCIGYEFPTFYSSKNTPADVANAMIIHLLYATIWNEDIAGKYNLVNSKDMGDWHEKSKDPKFSQTIVFSAVLDGGFTTNTYYRRRVIGPLNIITVDGQLNEFKERLKYDHLLRDSE